MSGVITFPYVPAAGNAEGAFAGIPPATLQLWLTQAQTALHQLAIGGAAVSLAYNSGDGSKSVTYTRATMSSLRAHIQELQRALGQGGRRRPIDVRFGG